MKVMKRHGELADIDISKIRKQTEAACAGLENVSVSELELDAQVQFYDGIHTEQIQQTLIKTACEKINVDAPDWTFVAARLFLHDLYKKAGKNSEYNHLKDYFALGEKEGRLALGFKEAYDLDDLNAYIKPERDKFFNYMGIKSLYDKYLIKDKHENPIELPQQMFMAIAMFLMQNEKNRQELAKQVYDMISKFEVVPATPILSNARRARPQLSSCYVGSTPDNIEGIFDAYKDMALLSKFGGGIGFDVTKIRSAGSSIDGNKGASGGTIPFLKIMNDICVGVDQLGTRKGAIAPYMELWHKDIDDFLDLRKNSGEERRRAHELFPAVWVNDLFMERVKENSNWTLFDPYEVSDLCDCWGKEFNKKYLAYENDEKLNKITINAKDLWKKILLSYFETGMPFLGFKDEANRRNPNSHEGIIRSSNLCTEIFQNTEPPFYKVKAIYESGEVDFFDEDEEIKELGKKAKYLNSLDCTNKGKIYCVEKQGFDGALAVCNLASVNLSKINTKEDIERVVPLAIRMLDNVIDLNYYPIKRAKDTNLKTRAIGLGIMGEAQMLAEKQIMFGSQIHLDLIDDILENISFNAIKTSSDLAKEKGAYPQFLGSAWSKGILPIDNANEKAKKLTAKLDLLEKPNWNELREKIKKDGMRNGYLMAIAPTSSISLLAGTTQTIEPCYARKWFEGNISGLIPVCVPNLNLDTWEYYVSAYDLDQKDLIKAAAVRQKWLDQGQSFNLFVNPGISGKKLHEFYMLAYELGLKSTYYLRSKSPDNNIEKPLDRSIECEGCQ